MNIIIQDGIESLNKFSERLFMAEVYIKLYSHQHLPNLRKHYTYNVLGRCPNKLIGFHTEKINDLIIVSSRGSLDTVHLRMQALISSVLAVSNINREMREGPEQGPGL